MLLFGISYSSLIMSVGVTCRIMGTDWIIHVQPKQTSSFQGQQLM